MNIVDPRRSCTRIEIEAHGVTDNGIKTVQQLVQDVIAPDVRELKVRMGVLEKQLETLQKSLESQLATLDEKSALRTKTSDEKSEARFNAADQRMEARFNAADQKSDLQFKMLLAAINESRAQGELTSMRLVASLSERVAVLESQRH